MGSGAVLVRRYNKLCTYQKGKSLTRIMSNMLFQLFYFL